MNSSDYQTLDSIAKREDLAVGVEVGYGVEILDGEWMITPRSGIEFSKQDNKYLLGNKISSGKNTSFDFEWSEGRNSNSDHVRQMKIAGNVKW